MTANDDNNRRAHHRYVPAGALMAAVVTNDAGEIILNGTAQDVGFGGCSCEGAQLGVVALGERVGVALTIAAHHVQLTASVVRIRRAGRVGGAATNKALALAFVVNDEATAERLSSCIAEVAHQLRL